MCGCAGNTSCGCIDNCHLPGQPEYGKCWKLENNAGCGCNGGRRGANRNANTPFVIRQKFSRFDVFQVDNKPLF